MAGLLHVDGNNHWLLRIVMLAFVPSLTGGTRAFVQARLPAEAEVCNERFKWGSMATEADVHYIERDPLDGEWPGHSEQTLEGEGGRSGLREALWIAACIVLLLTAIFARMMDFDMRRDEQLYVPPAVLLDKGSLYTDFFYNHVPGSAWLFHGFRVALGSDHLLLHARLGVFFGWVVLALGIAWITWRFTLSLSVTLFAIIAVLANDLLLNQTGMTATNNLLPLPLAVLGLGLFLTGVEQARARPFLVLPAGLLIALAAGTKANAIGIALPVTLAALFFPRAYGLVERARKVLLPLAVGGLLGALPVVYYVIRDAKGFFAHTLGFHIGPHVDYWQAVSADTEEGAVMTLGAKLRLAHELWLGGANLVIVLMIALLVAYLFYSLPWRSAFNRLAGPRKLVIIAAALMLAALSFVPTPAFAQYFALPLIALPFLVALLFASLGREARAAVKPAFIAASVVILLFNAPRLLPGITHLADPGSWTVMRVHGFGVELARRLRDLNVSGKVATLAPVYPLEGGLAVYPELATGQFAYRVADLTSSEQLRHFRTTSPTKIEALFTSDPPAALLVGFDAALEAPMVRFAKARGYRRIPDLAFADRYGEAVLYVRPAVPAPPATD